jgi:hypothetical protein
VTGCEGDHSSLSSTKVKTESSYTSAPLPHISLWHEQKELLPFFTFINVQILNPLRHYHNLEQMRIRN